MEIHITRINTIILFVILFVSVGWIAPAAYATYAPQERFVQSHSFETNNATIGESSHAACFDRTVKRSASGVAFTELYLVDENDTKIEIRSENEKRFFSEGRVVVKVETKIPDSIEAGVYHYERTYSMSLANGRVTRTFTFESNTFTITNNETSSIDC